jgi:hypothetical protein
MFQAKVVEKMKPNILFSKFFFKKIVIMWKNIVERGKPQMLIRRMRIACWIPKATNTHTQVILYLLLFHGNKPYASATYCTVFARLV